MRFISFIHLCDNDKNISRPLIISLRSLQNIYVSIYKRFFVKSSYNINQAKLSYVITEYNFYITRRYL